MRKRKIERRRLRRMIRYLFTEGSGRTGSARRREGNSGDFDASDENGLKALLRIQVEGNHLPSKRVQSFLQIDRHSLPCAPYLWKGKDANNQREEAGQVSLFVENNQFLPTRILSRRGILIQSHPKSQSPGIRKLGSSSRSTNL